MLLEVFGMCEVDKSDLATELQLLLPSPSTSLYKTIIKKDHLMDFLKKTFFRLKF